MGTRKANPVDAEVGRRIKLQRLSAGWSQTELGDKLGVTFQQVQKYERGQTRVGASRLTQIAKVLNVPIAEFFETAKPASKHESFAQSPLDLLSQPLALKLLQLFSEIADRDMRQTIVQLVEIITRSCQTGTPNGKHHRQSGKRSQTSTRSSAR
jgi:transcriptional regulator with XRE-family HTH domain